MTNAAPIDKIRKSAKNNKAQTELTNPAIMNKVAKNIKAIPVIISLLIFSIKIILLPD
jgi:hypothetical protein